MAAFLFGSAYVRYWYLADMPGMNGLDLVLELRTRHIETPAILITSHPNQSLRDRAAAANIPIIEKPLLNSLLDHVRRVVSQAGN